MEVYRVCAYVRCSTEEQADSGLGLEAQRTAIAAECERRGWRVVSTYEDAAASGKSLEGRPALSEALEAIRKGEASALVVSKLDRLSRSLLDFAALMERSRRQGWALVALDLGVDTTTLSGRLMANVMATFAEYERELIGQRTRDALAVKRSQGVKLGRPRQLPERVVGSIVRHRARGASLASIAATLNEEGVATAQGGARWHASTVRAVLAYATG